MSNTFLLLVEDNPDDEALALRALKKQPITYNVVVTRDGVEALDFLFGKGEYAGRDIRLQPEVVLLDLKLSKIDGLDVLKRIRADKRTQRIPVVILSSSDEERDIAASYDNCANSYICKPIDFDQFVEVIRHLGMYWMLLNRTS